jgi:DNA-binding PadR family transcriptional regulator
VTDGDPGHVYRALRSLERDRMVRSSWAPSSAGPARRVYQLTARGRAAIDATVPALEHATTVISRYLRTYAAHACVRTDRSAARLGAPLVAHHPEGAAP